ncbi:MAG: type I phosphomannose isomerase catalytic subunit [Bacteroidales bacterium]
MSDMLYPLKFKPILKEKIWGGRKIETILGKSIAPLQNCGESWEVSAIEENVSEISNGFLSENDLNELIEIYMGDLVGDKIYEQFGLGFPLLVKFIDAEDDLSVQVHPDDELAQQRYGQNGKNEIWYILSAEEGAGCYIGFKKGVTKMQYLQALENGTVDHLLEFYSAQKGDLFFIPAGTIHAIGKGILLAEIQQPSDITYRIFDWNRVDEEGNERELHLEEALDALHFEEEEGEMPKAGKVEYKENFNTTTTLFRSEFFNLNLLHFEKPIQKVFVEIDSFVIYICLEGHVHCFTNHNQETLEAGEVLLLPACSEEINLVPCHESRLLEIYLS